MAVSHSEMVQPLTAWIARFPAAQGDVVSLLRGEPDLMVLEGGSHLWIQSASLTTPLSEELSQRLQWIAVAELLHVTANGTVIPWGKRVPVGRVPTGTWQPLTEFITPGAPVARYAARRPEPATLDFKPCEDIIAPTLLRLPLSEWNTYVATAPNLRLSRWEFAAKITGDVLVRGTPLPSLPGQHYWEAEGLLIPCGWTWSPAVSADIIRQVLCLEAGDFALADCASSTWEIIPRESFVPARRQNVRRTVMERTAFNGNGS